MENTIGRNVHFLQGIQGRATEKIQEWFRRSFYNGK
jgi:hypothetical protein